MQYTDTKVTIHGPKGLRIELDAAQIFPSNPGNGTPAMVYRNGYSATFFCAMDTGELDCGTVELSDTECRWLNSQEGDVVDWLDYRTALVA
jgi:hypothetical protein